VVSRGEVWWVTSTAGGRRPHLVLTRDGAIGVLHAVIAVPATTTVRAIPTEVRLDEADGMPRACALSLDNLVTVPTARLASRITTLGSERMREVCRALSIATGCA
jgi:mRNA interferase MazF